MTPLYDTSSGRALLVPVSCLDPASLCSVGSRRSTSHMSQSLLIALDLPIVNSSGA